MSSNKKNKRTSPSTLLKKVQEKMMLGEKHLYQEDVIDKSFFKRKRKELISPLLSTIEYQTVLKHVGAALKHANDLRKKNNAPELSDSTRVSRSYQFSTDQFNYVPEHLIHDIFSMYFNSNKDMVLNSYNKAKREILDTVVDSMLKIVTENSYLASYFFTEQISLFLHRLLSEMSDSDREIVMKALNSDPNKGDDGEDGNGTGGDSMEKARQILEKAMSKATTQQSLKRAIEKAERISEEVEKLGFSVGKDISSIDKVVDIDNVLEKARAIHMSSSHVNKFFEKILTEGINYFSRISKTIEENLLEAEQYQEFLDLEFLIPFLKKFKILEMSVRNQHERGKFDLYIDISSSMGGDVRVNGRLTIAKAIALKFMRLGYVDNVYYFNTKVSEKLTDPLEILKYASGGGTSFSAVLKNCEKTRKNSIVITDGEDYNIGLYNPKVFWVSIAGDEARFEYFRRDPHGVKFIENKQCVVYNGKSFELVKPDQTHTA